MKVSLNWLQDHLDLTGRSTQELADLLTFAGVEVEGITQRGVASDKIVVAQVRSFEPHPNADRLRLCQVDDGSGAPRQIVCGAKNFVIGDKVPLALPGAKLPGDFEIKESKLRGVLSQGMMCSGRELGLSDDHEGLLILAADTPVGVPFHRIVEADTLYEVEITPNRPDLLSHRGMARELAALAQIPLKSSANTTSVAVSTAEPTAIRLSDPRCPYYTARKISGVKIGPSPEWLQKKLRSIGLRPINNVVDITNFVLMEMGQPLHAFDLAKLDGGIEVRAAKDGEIFRALDGKDYSLTPADLVIADSTSAVAIAGVMGGEFSGVTETTTEILLESAYFDPASVRRTSRGLGLISDSSYRFERGVDPQQVAAASALATRLIVEICGGTPEASLQAAGQAPVLVGTVPLDVLRCQNLLGVPIPVEEMTSILERLGLVRTSGTQFAIPSYRLDLQRPVDLIEEIARVYGIEKLPPSRACLAADESAADLSYDFVLEIKRRLAGLGWHEAQTIKLISAAELSRALGTAPVAIEPVPLKNPLSDDHTHLRPSLVPGLLGVAARNLRQGQHSLKFFEIGTVFSQGKRTEPDEKCHLALLLSGPLADATWKAPSPNLADMFELRGVLAHLCGGPVKLKPLKNHPWLLLGAQILLQGKPIGQIGQLRPSHVREMDGRHPLYLAELNLDQLQKALPSGKKFAELPKFPVVSRDVALAVSRDLSHGQIEEFFAAQQSKEPLLESVQLFDHFTDPTGQKLAADQKSVAYRLTYRSREKTLDGAEVDSVHQRVLAALKAALPVTLR